MIGLQYSEGVWYFLALDETKDVVYEEIRKWMFFFSVNGQYVLFCSIHSVNVLGEWPFKSFMKFYMYFARCNLVLCFYMFLYVHKVFLYTVIYTSIHIHPKIRKFYAYFIIM